MPATFSAASSWVRLDAATCEARTLKIEFLTP
jgi:hypothetical protein